MNRALKWLAVAGCVTVLAVVAGRMHFVRAAEEGPAYDRASEGGDAASCLDQIIEKLDRVVDRMQAERMGPPDRPPQRGPGGRGRPRGREEHGEHEEHEEHGERGGRGEPRHRGPGQPGERGGPAGPGMWSEGRPPRPPRADMPPEVREMIEKRMQEGRKRMEQAREKFQELEERVKKLEAEIERLKAA
jgi:hypothetical protein